MVLYTTINYNTSIIFLLGHLVASHEGQSARDVAQFRPWLSHDLGWSRLDFLLRVIQPLNMPPLPQLPAFIDLCLPEYMPSVASDSASATAYSARHVGECDLLFFMSEYQQLARDRNVTPAQLLSLARVVPFERHPPTSQTDWEAVKCAKRRRDSERSDTWTLG